MGARHLLECHFSAPALAHFHTKILLPHLGDTQLFSSETNPETRCWNAFEVSESSQYYLIVYIAYFNHEVKIKSERQM